MPVRRAHVALICSWIFGQCSALRWETDNVISCAAVNQYASEPCDAKILHLRSRVNGKGFDCFWIPASSGNLTVQKENQSQQCFRFLSGNVEYFVRISNNTQYDIYLKKDHVKHVFSDRFVDHPEIPLTYHINSCLPGFESYLGSFLSYSMVPPWRHLNVPSPTRAQ